MKNIEKNRIEQLLEIISDAPALRIAHFTEGGEPFIEALNDFCHEKTYEYQLNCTTPSFYEEMKTKFELTPHLKAVNFSLDRPRYMTQAKLYEYLFVTTRIKEETRSDFLKKVHGIIKNAGIIIVFLPKGSLEERYHWVSLLEEHYFVASNTIDDLFEHYDVLISKKMHGWGG
ncbi:MAG: hypothetical protein U9O24_00515 [Campylobacterota bacterium]|nr:hypothetical protein [Campylobacterota bacterium]